MLRITMAAARVNAGLKQKEAAEALGISNKTLGKWESGTAIPTADKVAKICELYRLPYDNIIFFKRDNA